MLVQAPAKLRDAFTSNRQPGSVRMTAIYSPEDGETDRIRRSLEPLAPLAMQRYTVSGIQSLV